MHVSFAVIQFKRTIGETVNITWEASTFAAGYNVYHKNVRNEIIRKNSNAFNVKKKQPTKDRNLMSSYDSIVMLEIRNVTLEDAGYYNGGWSENSVTSGGGAILIILGMNCSLTKGNNSSYV